MTLMLLAPCSNCLSYRNTKMVYPLINFGKCSFAYINIVLHTHGQLHLAYNQSLLCWFIYWLEVLMMGLVSFIKLAEVCAFVWSDSLQVTESSLDS